MPGVAPPLIRGPLRHSAPHIAKVIQRNEIGLSPKSLHCSVLDVAASAKAGYDGIGIRLFDPPGMSDGGWAQSRETHR